MARAEMLGVWVRPAAELKDLADKYEVYMCDETTLDEIRESILATMKCELHNIALQFKKFVTFEDEDN